jgi:8-oxo-dGTP pyrophosphatase MutT (NUDIX family)
MNSPSQSTIFYIVAVEALVWNGSQYLTIVRSASDTHAPGTLTFPAGKVENAGDAAHPLEAALHREVWEEAGVRLEPQVYYVDSKSFASDTGEPVVLAVFLARYAEGEAAPGDPLEVAEAAWMTVEQVLAHPKAPPWTHASILAAERLRRSLGW